MTRVGLIGAGWHSLAHHAPALQWCAALPEFRDRVELTALCDLDLPKARKAATEFGFRGACASIPELIDRVDAVVAILPTEVMADQITKIVDHRLPVLIEKPIGRDPMELEQIAAVLKDHPHMVSLNRRFDPGVRLLTRWLEGKQVHTLLGAMSRVARTEHNFIWSTGVHLADLVCHLVGPLRLVGGDRTSDGVVGLVDGNGVAGSIRFSPTAGRVEEFVGLAGDDFRAEVHTGTHGSWRVRCWRDQRVELDQASPDDVEEFQRNGTGDETIAFLRAVLRTGPYWPTVDDVRPGSRLASSIQTIT